VHGSQILRHGEPTGLTEALEPLLAPCSASTAIITTTDIEAATALRALSARGVRVPDDVSLLALADTALTELANPPITALRFSPDDMSRIAVDLVVAMLAGQRPRRSEHLVPVELVARESTRPLGVARISSLSSTLAEASMQEEL
jgi:DNA-binding LacI/PurR family transcriptional regulator